MIAALVQLAQLPFAAPAASAAPVASALPASSAGNAEQSDADAKKHFMAFDISLRRTAADLAGDRFRIMTWHEKIEIVQGLQNDFDSMKTEKFGHGAKELRDYIETEKELRADSLKELNHTGRLKRISRER